ncbi:hypothetical protein TeGR_g9103, partial [Tetraparma gracilis]
MPAPSLPSPIAVRPKTTMSSARSRKATTGKSNAAAVKEAEAKEERRAKRKMQKSQSNPALSVSAPSVPAVDSPPGSREGGGSYRMTSDDPLPRAGVMSSPHPLDKPTLNRTYSTNALTGTIKLEQPRERKLQ